MGVIIKRDGRRAEFNSEKIRSAMIAAFNECYKGEAGYSDKLFQFNTLCADVENYIKGLCDVTDCKVEEIQDYIVFRLSTTFPTVGSAYQRYREQRSAIRERHNTNYKNAIKKLEGNEPENLNANVDDRCFSGRLKGFLEAHFKPTALNDMMPAIFAKNHREYKSYIHDLDSYGLAHNCESLPLDDLLNKHTVIKQTDLRPARSISSALQMTAVYCQLQSLDMFGGVSATHIDTTMVPFFRHSFYKHYLDGLKYVRNIITDFKLSDNEIRSTSINNTVYITDFRAYKYALDMTIKETYQGVEALFHNLNSLQSRSGGQLPFTSINYGLETSPEGRYIIKAILDTTLKGLGEHGRTSIFPCQIFQMKTGVNRNPEDPNYDLFQLALKSTAKRIYPNYVNCDWTVHKEWIARDRKMRQELCDEFGIELAKACNAHPEWAKKMRLDFTYITNNNGDVLNFSVSPIEDVDACEEASTMGCRTQNGYNINAEATIRKNMQAMIDENFDGVFDGIFSAAQRDGRGNIAPQTIVLPEIAMIAKEKYVAEYDDNIIEIFFKELNKILDDTCESLKYRFDKIASQDASIAPFMYKNKTMVGYRENEGIVSALKNGTLAVGLLGMAECLQILIGTDHTTEAGAKLADDIILAYETKCNEYKNKYSLNYGVYYTPAESLAGKAMEHFKSKWGKVQNVTEHDYFTNSIHVPVFKNMSVFEKIDIESKFTKYGVAGVITYVELESSIQDNLSALETIVNYAMDNDIPYFAVNVPIDECTNCGWMQEMDVCPVCGSNFIRKLRRVTGYLSTDIPNSNKWKQAEYKDRVKHK